MHCINNFYLNNLFIVNNKQVKFGNKSKKHVSVDHTRFYLLHLGLLREYLELEFDRIKLILPFAYDVENIIDDWILMGFLIGNDFIPNLPHFHINENGFKILYDAYMDVLPHMDGYINEGGVLNLQRLEVFVKKLAEADRELFKNHSTDLRYMSSKGLDDETFGGQIENDTGNCELDEFMDEDLAALMLNSEKMVKITKFCYCCILLMFINFK